MNEKEKVLLTNERFKGYTETLKEKICSGAIVSKKNADGTYTATVSFYDLADYCKENNIDLAKTLSNFGFKKSVGNYSYNEIKALNKDYTYGTDTDGLQVKLIFEEFIRSNIVDLMDPEAIHRKLVARTIPVDSKDVRITFAKKAQDSALDLLNVKEGENLPILTNLDYGSEVITLGKVGGELDITYEALEDSKLNFLGIHYKKIATRYDATKDANLINTLKNGHEKDETKAEGGAVSGRGGILTTTIPEISNANLLPIIKYFKGQHYNFKYILMNSVMYREVLKVEDFGCFVELWPGMEGLVHVSQLANERVEKPSDVVKVGDEILVKSLGYDKKGRLNLSRKEALK